MNIYATIYFLSVSKNKHIAYDAIKSSDQIKWYWLLMKKDKYAVRKYKYIRTSSNKLNKIPMSNKCTQTNKPTSQQTYSHEMNAHTSHYIQWLTMGKLAAHPIDFRIQFKWNGNTQFNRSKLISSMNTIEPDGGEERARKLGGQTPNIILCTLNATNNIHMFHMMLAITLSSQVCWIVRSARSS